MTRSGIVLAGTISLDIVNIVDHWPSEETLAYIEKTVHAAGGPPHNAAAGLLKLAAPFPVKLVAMVGDDAYADTFLSSARSYGLDTGHIRHVAGGITSHTQIMSSAQTGRRTFFHQSGVNAKLSPADLAEYDPGAKLFYLGSPGVAAALDGGGGWQKLLSGARAAGMKTCLELVPVPAEIMRRLVTPCLPLCDYVVVNDYEAQSVTGLRTTEGERLDWPAAEAAARRLIEMGVKELAVIHHPDGAVAATAAGAVARCGSVKIDASEIVGSTGAGDAFYAGMLLGLHEEWPLPRCLQLANAAAATSLHSAETSATIRPWFDSIEFARQRGLRRIGD